MAAKVSGLKSVMLRTFETNLKREEKRQRNISVDGVAVAKI
jgi:hypothetical protein